MHNLLALGWPKLVGLTMVLISVHQEAHDAESYWVCDPFGTWGVRGLVPSYLLGGCGCLQCFLLSFWAFGGDSPTRRCRSRWRELLDLSQQEGAGIRVLIFCRGAGDRGSLLQRVLFGGLCRERGWIHCGHHKLVATWWKVQRGDCLKHPLLLDGGREQLLVTGSKT